MPRKTSRQRPGTYPRGEDTRRRLVETAIEIFAIHGYEGTSTRTLAERAGVNLPAIPYYFGSKQGLYRAAVEHIIRHIETRMGAIGERVRSALARVNPSRKELLSLLSEMLETFVAMVAEEDHPESRRLFFARAELESSAALDPLQECAMRQVLRPCAELIARLVGRPAEDEQVVARTLTLLGQVTIFCNKGARRALDWSDFNEDRVALIQALVREQTGAVFRAAKGAKP
jgi:TetR/AcrR family transcriptional regulator, regulator of cefoperazone and chloramphenicol sensitivity